RPHFCSAWQNYHNDVGPGRGLRNAPGVRHSDDGIISDWTCIMTCKPLLLAALLLGLVTAASAQRSERREQRRQQEQPELFQALVRCRAITDNAARLQCFDAASAAL